MDKDRIKGSADQDRSGRQGRSGKGQDPEYDRRNQRRGPRRIGLTSISVPEPRTGLIFWPARCYRLAVPLVAREPLIA
jgi:hypothetical protein